jgi:hypothetical protein
MKFLLACISFAVALPAFADSTLDYDVHFVGVKSGALKTVAGKDGRLQVSYSYRNNGRGPDIEEKIVLAPDGTIRSYRQTGKTTFGAILDERFAVSGKRASWQSPAEQGSQAVTGPALYLPTYGSPVVDALIVRATQKSGGRLAALPGGEVRSEKLAEAHVGPAGRERDIALYAILGIAIQPSYVWLDAGGDMGCLRASMSADGTRWSRATRASRRTSSGCSRPPRRSTSPTSRRSRPTRSRSRSSSGTCASTTQASMRLGEAADVYVNDGRIAAIYPANSPAKDPATVIDGAGRALLPGLFDMHTHEDAWNSILQVAGGVTSSRDMGNDNAYLAQLRSDIAGGLTIGPHIEPAGFIEGESPYSARGGFVVKDLDEARNAVDWYAERGYRQVKLYNSIKPEWAQPIAAYAHSRGMRVSGHVPAFSRSERVVRDGYDELQHINQMVLNFVSDPDTDSRTILRFTLVGERARTIDLDSPKVRDFIQLLVEHKTVIDATMATFEGTYTQKPGDMDPAMVPCRRPLPVRRAARLAQQFDGCQRWEARGLPRVLAAHDAALRPPARGGRPARRRHRQPRGFHAAPRARAVCESRHPARRGDPHRDRECRALRGRARGPRHHRARQARRPRPGRRRPDRGHLGHPQGELRAEGRRGLRAGRALRGVGDPALRRPAIGRPLSRDQAAGASGRGRPIACPCTKSMPIARAASSEVTSSICSATRRKFSVRAMPTTALTMAWLTLSRPRSRMNEPSILR